MNKPYDGFGVGSEVWVYDCNVRVYAPRKPGEIYGGGGPIYRESWVKTTIESETRKSWVAKRYSQKIPKIGPWRGVAFTLEALNDIVWAEDNRVRISDSVIRCGDTDKLRAIDAVLKQTPAPA